MQAIIIALCITSFWFFSPESLVLIGNISGAGAAVGVVILLLLSVVTFQGVSYSENLLTSDQQNGQHVSKKNISFSEVSGISGIIGTAVFASTGILVTAGFTFNEVFYYRFPNFAFAYLLLAIVLGVQFLPVKIRNIVLGTSMLGCFLGLLLLTVYGLLTKPAVPVTSVSESRSLLAYLPLLLVFVGIDQSRLILRNDIKRFRQVFFVSVLLLACWLFVSARFVDSERLLSSTVPYMTAGGKIAGNNGRLIIGMVIIFGSLGAVYGLMKLSSSYLRRLLRQQYKAGVDKVIFILLSIIIGVLMGAGVAGTPHLELFIRSSLLLWLVHTAIGIFSAAIKSGNRRAIQVGITLLSSGIILLGSLTLFLNQKELSTAATFTIFIIAASVALVIICNQYIGHNGLHKTNIIKNTEV